MQTLKVAYILLHFPHLTETFIAEEINAVQSQGVEVTIISLLKPKPGIVQELSRRLLSYAWYAPDLFSITLWRAQFHFFFKSPQLYLGLLATLLRQPYPRRPLRLSLERVLIFLKAAAVAQHLEGSDTKLLHAHFAWLSGAAAWIISRLLGLGFTVTVHAFDIYSCKNDLLNLVASQASEVIAISEFNRSQVAKLSTCPDEKISVIHCGVDLVLFQRHSSSKVEDPSGGRLRILSVGSLMARKGHTYLISACQILKEQGLDFICTIIGGGPDEIALYRQIEANGLQEYVDLQGARSQTEIMSAYHQNDLFVLASVVTPTGNMDGIPVVLMEAGAIGLPLLSTQVSGIPELVRHGRTGWLVPPGDATALAEAITTLAANPNLRGQLGQNARTLVESEFSIQRSGQQMAALFKRNSMKPFH